MLLKEVPFGIELIGGLSPNYARTHERRPDLAEQSIGLTIV